MNVIKVLNDLARAEKYFGDTSYKDIVERARRLQESGQLTKVAKVLEQLPSTADLLEKLVEKLKGKSVYKTLKKIEKNESVDNNTMLKGLGSLLTHVVIEMEHGSKEYKILLPIIYEKLGEVLYRN